MVCVCMQICVTTPVTVNGWQWEVGSGRGEGEGGEGGSGRGGGVGEWEGLTKERDHCSTAIEELFCWNTTVFQQDQILKSDWWKEADTISDILTQPAI